MNSHIFTYAFIKASYGSGFKQNPIDSLIPLVKRALMNFNAHEINEGVIQKRIKNYFGIKIPRNVIRYTYPSLRDEGILEMNNYIYNVVNSNYSDPTIIALEKQSKKQYHRLISRIQNTLNEKKMNHIQAEEALEEWLDTSSISFIGGNGFNTPHPSKREKEINWVVAHTIKNKDSGEKFTTDLTDVAMGDALYQTIKTITEYNVVDDIEEGRNEIIKIINSKMKDVSIFFDTRIVLRALRIVEDHLTQSALEMISMCKSLDGKICVFSHTVEEIQDIILQTAKNKRPTGDVAEYALRENLIAADLIELSLNIEDMIKSQSFEIIDPISVIKHQELGVKEQELDQILQSDMKRYREKARVTDIKSLTAIYRMRDGENKRYLEKCDSIFITSNKGLMDVSFKFFKKHFDELNKKNRVQLCMTDIVFSTRLWTKLPTTFDSLPRSQVIAHTFGNLYPSNELRDSFKNQLKKLSASGKISEHDVLVTSPHIA